MEKLRKRNEEQYLRNKSNMKLQDIVDKLSKHYRVSILKRLRLKMNIVIQILSTGGAEISALKLYKSLKTDFQLLLT